MKTLTMLFLMFVLYFLPVAAATPALAAGNDLPLSYELGAAAGSLNGNTLYHISSYDFTTGDGIESELKFPLDTTLVGVKVGVTGQVGRERDRFSVSLQWFTNTGNGTGKLQDSDWLSNSMDIKLVGAAHPGLDIYSTSDISLKADILDLRGSYDLRPSEQLSIGPLGGILYRHFAYDAENVHQVGYGPYAAGFTTTVAGRILTYRVTYVIPYIGAHAGYRIGNAFALDLDLGFSPAVTAEDRDDHLLRYKRSKGSASGNAYLASASARWEFIADNSLSVGWQYLKIRTTGSQTQTWYAAPNSDNVPAGYTISGINDRIESEQSVLSLLLSHRF